MKVGNLIIEVKNLTKIYNTKKGIFNVDFQVHDGDVFGFLGPNGAGKTTTIRQLLGFTNATEGSCVINGMDARIQAATIQKDLGYLPGEIAFFDHMSGDEFLSFISELRGLKNPPRKQELIDEFELETNRKIRKMSKGMKQKLALVASLMHDPMILILDEPTSGLDPLMQKRFIELILREKKRGKTIFLSSHLFEEVEKTCDRVAIIKDGKIVTIETIQNLKSQVRKSYRVGVHDNADAMIIQSSQLDYTQIDSLHFEIVIKDDYTPLLKVLSSIHVTELTSPEQSLEQIFISFYGKVGE